MAPIVTYEIYSFRNGNWMVDSVHDDKQLAIHQARLLLDSRHHMAIRVVEESYDEATDRASSKVVFSKKKSDEPPKSTYKKPEEKKEKAKPDTKKKKKKKASSGSNTVIKFTLSLGGIALGLISLLTFMILAFE
ncbi:MAG: hypothetical protein IIC04_05445 [Proteobacteria bacterium]|nr:hypothetical protein [Pseudomonadota bacterium]